MFDARAYKYGVLGSDSIDTGIMKLIDKIEELERELTTRAIETANLRLEKEKTMPKTPWPTPFEPLRPPEQWVENNPSKEDHALMRQFTTGATRSPDAGKIDYAGFLSPYALESFGRYMLKHQTQEDGKPRASDNWKKGIPIDSYHKSLVRHVVDYMRAYENGDEPQVIDLLDAIWFNVQGQLHERTKPDFSTDKPIRFTEGDAQPKPAPKGLGGSWAPPSHEDRRDRAAVVLGGGIENDDNWLKEFGPDEEIPF